MFYLICNRLNLYFLLVGQETFLSKIVYLIVEFKLWFFWTLEGYNFWWSQPPKNHELSFKNVTNKNSKQKQYIYE